MGYGIRLKEILEEKDEKVIHIAKQCRISPTTLYSAIQRDSPIRYDYALLLAEALNIDPREICSTVPSDYVAKSPQLDYLTQSYRQMNDLQRARLVRYVEKMMKEATK